MGQVSSAFGDSPVSLSFENPHEFTPKTLSIPPGYKTPPFPSLYGPSFISTQTGEGIFLYEAQAIWEFTLYWTIILLCGTFLLCSIYASCNIILSLTVFRRSTIAARQARKLDVGSRIPTPDLFVTSNIRPATSALANGVKEADAAVDTEHRDARSRGADGSTAQTPPPSSLPRSTCAARHARAPPKRPPLWPVFLLPVIACLIAAVISLISATVIGFALAAVYSAGAFSMSTWVPFLWALIQVLVLVISSYSTLTAVL